MHAANLYPVAENLEKVLKTACYDCHSNYTEYPWYASVQPVAWYLADHVNDGKRHFNFSTFAKLRIAIQNHKLEEVIEQVKEGEMPMTAYTLIHRDAALTNDQKALIIQWAQSAIDSIHAHYPADSLKMPERKRKD